MKRFFMYCIVIVGAVFVGLAFYMFAKNNEVIDCTIPQGETIYLNVGDDIDIPINHTKKDKRTTVETLSDNSNVALVNAETKKIEAKAGGTATIVITPSNENFGPFTFTLRVGDGSNENPYFISKASQMLMIGNGGTQWSLSDSYEVVSNIDMKETWVDGKAECWKPIGDSDKHFTGNFNGGTKTISNIVIDESCTSDYVGLFGYVESGAKVERVTLVNPQIKVSGKNVGAIAGYSEGAITRCRVVGGEVSSSVATDVYVGGIAGVASRGLAENEIAMCSVDGTALRSANVVAGIAGKFVSGVIANCKVNARIAGLGENKPKAAAGLVGAVDAKNISQGNSVFTYNSLIQTNLVMPVFESGVNGVVLIAADNLSGDSKTDYVGNLFYVDGMTSKNATQLTREQVEDQTNYKYTNSYSKVVSWDFVGTWSFEGKTDTDSIGPYIIQDGAGQNIKPLRNGSEIKKDNAEEIINNLVEAGKSNVNQNLLSYTYVITENIELDFQGKDWTPIGNGEHPFSGVIYGVNGATLTLKNVNIPSKNIVEYSSNPTLKEKTAGIFGYTSNTASISDIVVANMIINSDNKTFSGALVGKNFGVLKNCEVYGINIKNGRYVGGISGYNAGDISYCTVAQSDVAKYGEFKETPDGQETAVDVVTQVVANGDYAIYVGGIVGLNAKSVYCCKADVGVSGSSSDSTSYVGGVVGNNSEVALLELGAKVGGEIAAGGSSLRVGGVVGLNRGVIKRSYCQLCQIVAAKGKDSFAGGVVGENQQGKVSSSYFDGTIEGNNVGGIVGSVYGGVVEKSYSNATIISSKHIGGLAYLCQGTIKNCYFEASGQVQFAEGKKDDNVFAGLAVELPEGGYIETCYASTSQGVSSNGENYLDINTTIRSNIASFWAGLSGVKYGSINNNVINSNGINIDWWEMNIRKGLWSSKGWGSDSGWKFRTVKVDPNGMLDGSTTGVFTSECNFDTTIWDFSGSTPKLFGLNISGVIEDEFAEASINVALAEENSENVSFENGVVKVTGFSESATITLNVTAENTEEIPAATRSEGNCVEVGAVADGKLTITVNAVGTAKIQLTLTDGTILELTVEIAA